MNGCDTMGKLLAMYIVVNEYDDNMVSKLKQYGLKEAEARSCVGVAQDLLSLLPRNRWSSRVA
jgi:hypothetical protein